MPTLETRVRELIHFYVRTNYENYLEVHSITTIPKSDIPKVMKELYTEKKDHLKEFIKQSLKHLMKDEYPGDLVILNILLSVFEDNDLCVNRLIMEITIHQQGVNGETYDYRKL